MKQSEKALQEDIVTWLRLALPHALVFQFARPGGHKALMGAVPVGCPDLLVIIPGSVETDYELPKHFFFEVKTLSGRLTIGQEAMWARLGNAGCLGGIVRSVAAVRKIVVDAGCEPRGGL